MIEVLITAVVATFSAILCWLLSHYWQSNTYNMAVDNERAQWNADVEVWARNVVEVLSRLRYHFDTMERPEAVEASSELSLRLSILIDQGRLYFPNVIYLIAFLTTALSIGGTALSPRLAFSK